jgi:uncharacterized SAM-binding protein YcdF (DUF218 family)
MERHIEVRLMETLRLLSEYRWLVAGCLVVGTVVTFAWILPYCGQWLVAPTALEKTDAIVVLGSGLLEDNSHSSDSLRRTIQGITLLKKGYAPHIIFTGGGWPVTAAQKMSELALEMGVSPGAITADDEAESTFENAQNVRRIFDENGWRSALVVTSAWHSLRGSLVFRKQGFIVYNAPVTYYEKHGRLVSAHIDLLESISIETVKLIYYRWKGWI